MANDIYQSSAGKKDINYTGKDFNSFRSNLIEYAKSYFHQHIVTLVKTPRV